MRKMLVGALLAAFLVPVAAQAQDGDHNRGEWRGEHRGGQDGGRDHSRRGDDNRSDGARRDGDHRDGGRWDGQRRDGPGYDRRDGFRGSDARRGDYRNDDWRGWRDRHPGDYRRGGWRAPFAYRSFGIGAIAPRGYWGSQYYVNDWGRYHLPSPGYGYYRYVRHYDDVLLINIRNGRVIRVYRGFYR